MSAAGLFASSILMGSLAVLLTGCVGTLHNDADTIPIDRGKLSPADISLTIPGLGPCTDGQDRTVQLNSREPVTVLVHGCRGSAGRFRALAEVFAFQGQQTVCYSYNDRDSLLVSSAGLTGALDAMLARMHNREVTVIGHSQGGLVARRALVAEFPEQLTQSNSRVRLVTISAPFAGIAASRHCGSKLERIISLGLTVPVCWLISGDKWNEINEYADFIRKPGKLVPQVGEFLKIATDEAGSCRSRNGDGACVEKDFVFSLQEQYFPAVDKVAGVTNLEVKAGHVEIVGDARTIPVKLISVLQEQKLLKATAPAQQTSFQNLLVQLYTK